MGFAMRDQGNLSQSLLNEVASLKATVEQMNYCDDYDEEEFFELPVSGLHALMTLDNELEKKLKYRSKMVRLIL